MVEKPKELEFSGSDALFSPPMLAPFLQKK